MTGRPGTAPTILTSAACTSPGSTTSTAPVASSSVIAKRVARVLAWRSMLSLSKGRTATLCTNAKLNFGLVNCVAFMRAAAGAQAQGGQEEHGGDGSAVAHV